MHWPDWQPIESAPKDGTVVLVFVPDDRAHACWWDAEYRTIYDEASDDIRYVGAWTDDRVYSFNDEETYSYEPTHWMSLPPAPKVDSALPDLSKVSRWTEGY